MLQITKFLLTTSTPVGQSRSPPVKAFGPLTSTLTTYSASPMVFDFKTKSFKFKIICVKSSSIPSSAVNSWTAPSTSTA